MQRSTLITDHPQQAKEAAKRQRIGERAKHARRSELRGHYHRAPQHPVRLASLVKNRQSKVGRLLDRAIRVPKQAAAEQQSTIGRRGPTADNL